LLRPGDLVGAIGPITSDCVPERHAVTVSISCFGLWRQVFNFGVILFVGPVRPEIFDVKSDAFG